MKRISTGLLVGSDPEQRHLRTQPELPLTQLEGGLEDTRRPVLGNGR